MSSSNSIPETNGSDSPIRTNLSMSQGGYLSAVVNNISVPSFSPMALIPSYYSRFMNAAERSQNTFSALPNSSFATPTEENDHEIVYPHSNHFPMHSNNNNDNLVGNNQAALYDFSNTSPLLGTGSSYNNVGFQAFGANNSIPPQFPNYSQPLISSGYSSQFSYAEIYHPTNPTISGINRAKSPPPAAQNSTDLITVTGSNNNNNVVVNSVVPYASDPSACRIRSRNELLPFVCSDCLDRFSCPQALGGHRSWHSKQRRKMEENEPKKNDVRGNKKFKSKSS